MIHVARQWGSFDVMGAKPLWAALNGGVGRQPVEHPHHGYHRVGEHPYGILDGYDAFGHHAVAQRGSNSR